MINYVITQSCSKHSDDFIYYALVVKTRMGEKRNVYRLLVGKSEGKRPLGRP
jgi:hypothetical protein